jgi:hypothetical protein
MVFLFARTDGLHHLLGRLVNGIKKDRVQIIKNQIHSAEKKRGVYTGNVVYQMRLSTKHSKQPSTYISWKSTEESGIEARQVQVGTLSEVF